MRDVAELAQRAPETRRDASPVYTFKDDPYSSHSLILRMAGEGRGRQALDVGAADGYLARRLAAAGWRVTAIERDPVMAEAARPFCERVIVWDLNEPPPELGQKQEQEPRYDLIIYGDILEHLLDPEAVFGRINDWLAPEGGIIVSIPNVAHLAVRLLLLAGRFDYMDRGILDRTHRRFFTRKSFLAFMEQGGIELTELQTTPVPLPLLVPSRHHGAWLRIAHRLSAWSARCWPAGLGYQFVAEGRRRG